MARSLLIIALAACMYACLGSSGNHIYNILDYGARGDSSFVNTLAIQRAIDACTAAGGGTVLVPPGIYISGTIHLKDNVKFEVMAGATILGSADLADYYEHKWGHNNDRQPYHLILAYRAKNIEICGGGIIDGNGPAFWKDFEPDSLPQWIMAKELKISPMFEVEECTDVRISDVTLKTGGGWTLHLYNSDHVQVRGVKILNNVYAPNGDGIDITGCYDVTISDCIIKTCDDAICVKTTVDSRDSKRIVVTNCVIECLCAALKIGNESFRDISQITFSNCVIYGSSRAFAIYAESAGTISDIVVDNIVTDSQVPLLYNRPIHLSLYLPAPGAGNRNGDWMFKDKVQWDYQGREPQMKNITISNFTAKTEGRILITAEDGRFIENLKLSNINLTYPWIENPITYVDEVKSSQFAPVKRSAKIAPAAMVLENVKNLQLSGLNITWPESDEVPMDWQFKKKIANGTLNSFFPVYGKAVEVDFHAIYGRGLSGGFIQAYGLTATSPVLKPIDIKSSSVRVFE
jgi:hypothetical protein